MHDGSGGYWGSTQLKKNIWKYERNNWKRQMAGKIGKKFVVKSSTPSLMMLWYNNDIGYNHEDLLA